MFYREILLPKEVLTLVSVSASVLIIKEETGRLKVAPGVKATAGAARRKAVESFMVNCS